MASQSHRICVADSSSCRHLSQVGSPVSPSLKRCQCPVSNPTTHLSWSLFSFNRSFVHLAEGPDINPFACLSPVVDSQYFLWFQFVQSLTTFLAAPIEMPQAGSGPMNGFSDPVLASWSADQLNSVTFSQLYEALVAVPNQFWSDLVLPSALIAAWLSDRM
jgi:hypothetical protein